MRAARAFPLLARHVGEPTEPVNTRVDLAAAWLIYLAFFALRLAGQGMPRRDGGYGDLLAQVRIVVPERLSSEQRALFEQLRVALGAPAAAGAAAEGRADGAGGADGTGDRSGEAAS